MSLSKPGVQSACLSLFDHLHKVLSQLIEVLQISIGVADALNERRWSAVSCCWSVTNNQDTCRGERRRLTGAAACRFLPRARSGGPGKRARQSAVSLPTNEAEPRNPLAWISRAS